MYIQQVIAESR